MPRLLSRVLVVMGAIAGSLVAAGLVLTAGLLGPDLLAGAGNPGARTSFGLLLFLSTNLAVKVGIVPAFVVSTAGEAFRLRSAWIYAGAGAVVSLTSYLSSGFTSRLAPGGPLSPLPHEIAVIVAAGLLAGLAYWALAGRNAGAWRSPAAPG